MSDLKHIKAGDTVFVVYQRSRLAPPNESEYKEVVRVGRQYGYIKRYSLELPFHLDSGVSHHKNSNDRSNGYGFDVYVSEEEYRKERHEADELARLKKRLTGSTFTTFMMELSPEAVQQIHAILDDAKEES